MILADKMIALRKKAGWSQEELAEKMGVTRQSVSKWEGAQSMPDLDKILTLSRIFGVSTDYLLKDEIEDVPGLAPDSESEPKRRRVTMEDANRYLTVRKQAAPKMALATALCVLSPVALIFLAALSETKGYIQEGLAAGIGLLILLGLVSCAVAIFIFCDAKEKDFAFLEKELFETEYGVTGMVKERKERFAPVYTRLNIIGTVLCVLSPLPLILLASLEASDFVCIAMTCVLLIMIAFACFAFVWGGTVQGSMDRLLEEGDFCRRSKTKKSVKGAVSVIYWGIVAVVFLIWTCGPFEHTGMKYTWLVWAIGGILYTGIAALFGVLEKNKRLRGGSR